MSLKLFPHVDTEDLSFANHNEHPINYLARSSREESVDVKNFLESAFRRYPDECKNDLLKRLKDIDVSNCRAAIFELIMHELLCSVGYSVTVHPTLENSSKKPDFLVDTGRGGKFYLEATSVGAGKVKESFKKEQRRLFEEIDKYFSFVDNATLGISIVKQSSSTISRKDLFITIKSKLDDLNNKELNELEWIWESASGWEIRLALLKTSKKYDRFISGIFPPASFINITALVNSALNDKGTKYGKLPYPFVIAIDLFTMHTDFCVEMDALFGTQLSMDETKYTGRIPNGAWNGTNGPQYTGVSSLWLFDEMTAWRINRRNCMYLNPWAKINLPEEVYSCFSHVKPIDESMVYVHGKTVYEQLNLIWPWYHR